ncbi:MAG TPA: FAD-dependent oxidoreductase [Solirubrobacteraceae bacterium]|nr:FAD-dependent oxidoreductase [Solirubrobacteraceae bacterium]
MSLPVLFAVYEDEDVLDRLRTQLGTRYGHDYRVQCLADPDEALRLLAEIAAAGEEAALVLAGNVLWDADGGEGLERVRALHPHAKRALLVPPDVWTNHASAEAIRDSIALGRIDYYVVNPAPGLDEGFHVAITSFLLEWASDRRLVPQTIHVVGEEWSGRAYELREVLERCAVPHAFCLADSDQGRELLGRASPETSLPLILLPNGRALGNPTDAEMAVVAGAPSDLAAHAFDVVIIGAGPAGLSAAVYGSSEGLRTLVVDEGGIGGQARSSSLIRNFLGFPKGISGSLLAEQAYEQASVFGTDFLFMHRATSLARVGDRLELTIVDGRRVTARAVILAAGATYRRLGVPALEALTGAGVFYGGAASEAHALSGKDAFVAGGGNSAGQAALHLARYAREVTIVIRGDSLGAGMSHYLVREIGATPNVTVRTETVITGGAGEGRLERLVLRHGADGEETTVAADALFVLIGARPHTDWLPAEVARDERGFLLTGDEVAGGDWPLDRRPLPLETSMPGVLAAGDVRHASVKRVASAVGEGSIAIQLVHGLLTDERVRPAASADAPSSAALG